MSREEKLLALIKRTEERIAELEVIITRVMLPVRWHFALKTLELNKHVLAEAKSLL